jgi:hypothetical protein
MALCTKNMNTFKAERLRKRCTSSELASDEWQRHLKTFVVQTNFCNGADFSYIFFRGKSLPTEFLGKTMIQNFSRGKLDFFPTFFGGKFSAKFSAEFFPEKNVRKIGSIQ